VPDVLIFADTIRSPELRHEVPVATPDPFVYIERQGRRAVFVPSMEIPRLAGVDGLECVPLEELGWDELVVSESDPAVLDREVVLRACRHAGITSASVPASFPLSPADYLRAHGVSVASDPDLFARRRRVKSPVELEGIRRAQRACEEAMDAVRAILRDESRATSEQLRAEAARVFTGRDLQPPDIIIVSHGAQTAVGHEPGTGAIAPGEPITVDLFPRDPESGCYADMTRTFCVGDPPAELVEQHRLCRDALDLVYAAIRPGVLGSDLHRLASDHFQEHGYPTQLSKQPGEILEEGFYHALGHGIGLEVHELPYLGRNGTELVAGDVVAIEPGLYRKDFGGCRLEDIVLVTEDGCEVLTDYSYDLTP
jgi:Xaa-Pro aminopeptidase